MMISDYRNLNMDRNHGNGVYNLLFQDHRDLYSPCSEREPNKKC